MPSAFTIIPFLLPSIFSICFAYSFLHSFQLKAELQHAKWMPAVPGQNTATLQLEQRKPCLWWDFAGPGWVLGSHAGGSPSARTVLWAAPAHIPGSLGPAFPFHRGTNVIQSDKWWSFLLHSFRRCYLKQPGTALSWTAWDSVPLVTARS